MRLPRLVLGMWVGALLCAGALGACARATQRAQERQAGAATAVPSTAPAAVSTLTGGRVETVQVGEAARAYRLYVPDSVSSGAPVPLVLNFHGLSSNAREEEALSAMSAKADREGFIVVYPEGSGSPQRWNIGPEADGQADLDFVRAIVSRMEQAYAIDPARIYATGISNGAQMTNHLGCAMADLFAALAPVAGGYFRAEQCQPARPIPIVEFHGTADRLLPYAGDGQLLLPIPDAMARWAERNGCAGKSTPIYQNGKVKGELWGNCRENADVELYTVEGGGHSWPGSPTMPRAITTQDVNATDVMWDFFARHPKP